jgi:hypothetical protein
MVLAKDKPATGVYTVTNEGEEAVQVKVEIEDWLKLKTGEEGLPLEEWLSVSPIEFTLEPGEVKQVTYDIHPPSDYTRELIAMVFFSTTQRYENAFNITGRIGVSIYAVNEGAINLSCTIESLNIIRRERYNSEGELASAPIAFQVTFVNTGDVHVRPIGTITITSDDGTEYAVNVPKNFPIYQGQNGTYMIRWKKIDVAPGHYRGIVNLTYGYVYNINKTLQHEFSFTVKEDGTIEQEGSVN